MKTLGRLGAFAAHLAKLEAESTRAGHDGLNIVAHEIEKTAKSQFGHYQPAIGGFNAWAPLKEATKEDRVRQGYPPDEPLLRSGGLRDSVTHEVSGLEAVIGSTSDVMVYQELGTDKIPPRPVLGPALLQNRHKIEQILGQAIASVFIGKTRRAKYDSET